MDREIVFTYGNQMEFYRGIARNHSRFGLYFESTTSMPAESLLFIRASGSAPPGAGKNVATAVSSKGHRDDDGQVEACSEWKTLIVAKVRRCSEIGEDGESVYGIAVEYVSPAV